MRAKSIFHPVRHLEVAIAAMAWLLLVPAGHSHAGEFKPEELVCRMEPGYSIDTVNNAYGTFVKGFVTQTGCYLLGAPSGLNAESLAVEIGQTQGVQYCGANYYVDAPEPLQRSHPFLDVEATGDYEDQLAVTTLDLTTVGEVTDGDGVAVAVIDGGVNFSHPAFAARPGGLYSRWDYVDADSIANDEPGGVGSGHGTFVAGVINLVAPGCDIYAYRVLDTVGRGDGYAVTQAVLQAIEDGCKVLNLSLGMIGRHDALDDALKYAESQDITVVAAAGNDATENDIIFPFPAKKAACLTVAALDSLNIKADFSNYGYKVDICAPGTRVYSPFLDTSYAWWDGTSFAAPFVAGLAALMHAVDSLISWEEIVSIIDATAINIDSLNPGLEGRLGAGLIDPVKALGATARRSCGDIDGTDEITTSDLILMVNYVFRSGEEPYPLLIADVDCCGVCNASDLIYLVNYIFKGGPAPCVDCP